MSGYHFKAYNRVVQFAPRQTLHFNALCPSERPQLDKLQCRRLASWGKEEDCHSREAGWKSQITEELTQTLLAGEELPTLCV